MRVMVTENQESRDMNFLRNKNKTANSRIDRESNRQRAARLQTSSTHSSINAVTVAIVAASISNPSARHIA